MKRLWLDLGDPGIFLRTNHDTSAWQDHGLGLLRTIMDKAGVHSDVASTRNYATIEEVSDILEGYDMLLMNVRSYNLSYAEQAARLFKKANPNGWVIVGGMHATLSPEELVNNPDFDRICQGDGENIIIDLASDPSSFDRMTKGKSSKSLNDWPFIDRLMWPRPKTQTYHFPLEPAFAPFGPSPMVSIITSRVCPWRCSFCNEASYIPAMERKSPEQIVDELNYLDKFYGPIGSVMIHDSLFFQQPTWLERWAEVYPHKARKVWPYWAAARADTVRRWPDLFMKVARETNWSTVSIGLESGSNNTLKTLNKECTAEDNIFAISLINRLGDEFEANGRPAPKIFSNIIYGSPGETREDALDTLRMLTFVKRPLISSAYFAPYAGAALGYQIIAEGKSLMAEKDHLRNAGKQNVDGVDYAFFNDILAGKHTKEAWDTRNIWLSKNSASDGVLRPLENFRDPSFIFSFQMTNGGMKLSYGKNAEEAFSTLKYRLTDDEMALVIEGSGVKTKQTQIHSLKNLLK